MTSQQYADHMLEFWRERKAHIEARVREHSAKDWARTWATKEADIVFNERVVELTRRYAGENNADV